MSAPRSPEGAVELDAVELDAVERLVDDYHAGGAQPGLAYAVVRHGQLLHTGARGTARLGGPPPDPDTVFRIASMTKSFTAATVLLLRDEGRLRLDDELVRWVPEVTDLRPPTDDAPALTVRTLLTMTAGFPTDDPWGDRQQDLPEEDFESLLRGGLSFAWTPGTTFEYSNLSYALLGRVISAAAGRPYAEVVTQRLLAPLGMASTWFVAEHVPSSRLAQGYRPGPQGWDTVPFAGYGSFAPMGGLFSSLRDLARWVGGLAAGYPPRDGAREPVGQQGRTGRDQEHPLRRASRRELQQAHRSLPPLVTWTSLAGPPLVRGAGYGFGLVVELDPRLGELISHSGGYPGFGSHMRWHPGSGLGVIVLANATYAPAARLGGQLLDRLLSSWPPPPRKPGPVTAAIPASGAMTAATAAAHEAVNQLLACWDDGLADRLLAANVAADEPLEHRRAAIEEIARTLGPLQPEPDGCVRASSPAHCLWWLRGPGGRVRVEIRMSPQRPTLVQTLTVTPVPNPPRELRELADRVAEAMADPSRVRALGLRWAPELDAAEIDRQLRVAAAWLGPSRVTQVLAGDGAHQATFQLTGRAVSLALTMAFDPDARTVTALSLTPG